MKSSHLKYRSLALMCLLCGLALAATEDEHIECSIPASVGLPSYTYPYQNPLYGTIAGFLKIKNVQVPGERVMQLYVPGFEVPVAVHAVLQDGSAPLAVVLLGIGGRADADFSRLWPAWFAEAGYNVLFFDSTFNPKFMNTVPKGPSGNLWAEAESVRDIIASFLARGEAQGKISEVGIAGMSYGGLQALILAQMASEGRVPFAISGIQAWSPPANLEYTAGLFDRWFNESRWNYTLISIQTKVGLHNPIPNDSCCVPLSDDLMHASVAASFHEQLPDIVTTADRKFGLRLLPQTDGVGATELRQYHAQSWGFTKYAFDLAIPYWQCKLGPSAIDTLIRDTQLCELLRKQPRFSETIFAADDPFNPPSTLEDIKDCSPDQRVTILPHGGHLGYLAEPWTRAKLMTLFSPLTQVGVR